MLHKRLMKRLDEEISESNGDVRRVADGIARGFDLYGIVFIRDGNFCVLTAIANRGGNWVLGAGDIPTARSQCAYHGGFNRRGVATCCRICKLGLPVLGHIVARARRGGSARSQPRYRGRSRKYC